MERLCDEVLQLIFCELIDPSPLTRVSKRFYRFSQDPYVRAHYFINHYGPGEAVYYALGRGKVVTERVLDILLSSGAHLSRYLVQIAAHHYFYTQTHFIKTHWVRHVPLGVMSHFLKLAAERYGDISFAKGDDDGSIFAVFLKESRLPSSMKTVAWESIKTLMETYNFIPFSNRDPIMSQFPLALAVEPRLLPYAVANGFSLDPKYRDFVFRKMFERPSSSSETRAEDVAQSIRELCKLDPSMFVTRTVAAEICMEAKANEIGYAALKLLNKSGHLRFELSMLVEDLLKTFLRTRSICSAVTGETLLYLFTEFRSSDNSVRLVMLVLVFLAAEEAHMSTSAIRAKLELLGLTPITRRDLLNVLVNPFVEKFECVLAFGRQEVSLREGGPKGMSCMDTQALVEDVAVKCLEIACKGKLLKKLTEKFSTLKDFLGPIIVKKYQIDTEDLPSSEAPSSQPYQAKLCLDFLHYDIPDVHTPASLMPEPLKKESIDSDVMEVEKYSTDVKPSVGMQPSEPQKALELGLITQESLTTMIRHDEATPVRSRRRIYYSYAPYGTSGKLTYPHDPIPIGRWAKSVYDAKSDVMAVFMTHAVLNDNTGILHHYIVYKDPSNPGHVPVTFKHFHLLARFGKAPNFYLWNAIEAGAQFYMDENDFLLNNDATGKISAAKQKVKVEVSQNPTASLGNSTVRQRRKKRPRRSAAQTVRSYAVPGSDDEEIAEDVQCGMDFEDDQTRPRETNLELWIKHLSQLLKTETRKYAEKKKHFEKTTSPDKSETRVRLVKNDFVRSLTVNLRNLRKIESETRALNKSHYDEYIPDHSDNEDDGDYMFKKTKRRKTTQS